MGNHLSEKKSLGRFSSCPRLLAVVENGRRGKKILATYLGCEAGPGDEGSGEPRIVYEFHRPVIGGEKSAEKNCEDLAGIHDHR